MLPVAIISLIHEINDRSPNTEAPAIHILTMHYIFIISLLT